MTSQLLTVFGYAVILFYDHIITFNEEYCKIWTKPWCKASATFLLTRYVALLTVRCFISLLKNDSTSCVDPSNDIHRFSLVQYTYGKPARFVLKQYTSDSLPRRKLYTTRDTGAELIPPTKLPRIRALPSNCDWNYAAYRCQCVPLFSPLSTAA